MKLTQNYIKVMNISILPTVINARTLHWKMKWHLIVYEQKRQFSQSARTQQWLQYNVLDMFYYYYL